MVVGTGCRVQGVGFRIWGQQVGISMHVSLPTTKAAAPADSESAAPSACLRTLTVSTGCITTVDRQLAPHAEGRSVARTSRTN
jgi:hypothetical protein